jgi:nitrogen fixation protein FixH
MKSWQAIWKGRNPWPTAIIGYFVVFISFLIGFVAFASRQRVELVRKDYYDEEILFQQQIDRAKRTQPFHGRVFVNYDAAARGITVAVPPEHVSDGFSGKVTFYRPSDSQLDRRLELRPDSTGRLTIDARGIQGGLWRVRIDWSIRGLEYSYEDLVVIGL